VGQAASLRRVVQPAYAFGVWQKVAAHPLVPILCGVALTMDTAGNVVLKGYTFLVLWIWMCVDVGLWLRSPGYTKEWKIIRFQAIGGAGAISMLMTIHRLLDLKLDEKQQDVYRNISARVSLPQELIPSLSLFSVSNGGNSTIGLFTPLPRRFQSDCCFTSITTDW
jgi:hypothetical protein